MGPPEEVLRIAGRVPRASARGDQDVLDVVAAEDPAISRARSPAARAALQVQPAAPAARSQATTRASPPQSTLAISSRSSRTTMSAAPPGSRTPRSERPRIRAGTDGGVGRA